MGSSGLEPPTSRLSGVRSNHLSYEPISASLPISDSSAVIFARFRLVLGSKYNLRSILLHMRFLAFDVLPTVNFVSQNRLKTAFTVAFALQKLIQCTLKIKQQNRNPLT